jgi:hypothetical protein
LQDSSPLEVQRRARVFRRAFLSLMAALVVAAVFGFVGLREASTQSRDGRDGYSLSVRYPRVIRPGQAGGFQVQVTRAGGFGDIDHVRVRVTAAYLDLFEQDGFDPQPETATTDGTWLDQTFLAPQDTNQLSLSFNARLNPGGARGKRGTAEVLGENGEVLASASWSTTVVP